MDDYQHELADRRWRAYHEAGHAAVAWLGGKRLIHVALLGTAAEPASTDELGMTSAIWLPSQAVNVDVDVMSAMAGILAESRVTGAQNWQGAGACLRVGFRALNRKASNPSSRHARWRQLWKRAQLLLGKELVWAGVIRLASRLETELRLDGADSVQTLEGVIAEADRERIWNSVP